MFKSKAHMLFDNGTHQCMMFSDLVKGSGIQANQFLIVDSGRGAVIDPGGDLTYAPLSIEVRKKVDLKHLDWILASHQDPDIIAALGRWMMQTNARVLCSRLWSRFLPHLAVSYMEQVSGSSVGDRIVGLPDRGGVVQLGESSIVALPAHFLHSVGNFQFFDVTSGILFSGDMGASMVDDEDGETMAQPVTDFDEHVATMAGFHRRYMCGQKACRLWANMVRELKPTMIVPQHGKPFAGEVMINRFLDWISELECGLDNLSQNDYLIPAYEGLAAVS